MSFDFWRVRYKIGQIIAIPQIHSIFIFASFVIFGWVVTQLNSLSHICKVMNAIWSVFVLLTLENRWSLKQDFLAWSIIATMIVELSELCSEVEGYTVKNS